MKTWFLVSGRPYGRQIGEGRALREGHRVRSEVEVGRRLLLEEFGAHAAETDSGQESIARWADTLKELPVNRRFLKGPQMLLPQSNSSKEHV